MQLPNFFITKKGTLPPPSKPTPPPLLPHLSVRPSVAFLPNPHDINLAHITYLPSYLSSPPPILASLYLVVIFSFLFFSFFICSVRILKSQGLSVELR